MDTWYAVLIDLKDSLTFYKLLRERAQCHGVAGGILYKLALGEHIYTSDKVYIQLVQDSGNGWHYVATWASESNLQDQSIVLTMNEFVARFFSHTTRL